MSIRSDPELSRLNVWFARDSVEGIRLFKENRANIVAVTTDRAMELSDAGDRLVREIRKIELEAGAVDSTGRGVGIAMISGTLPTRQSELNSIGADKYVEKSVDFDKFQTDFKRTVREMIMLTHQRRPELLRQ